MRIIDEINKECECGYYNENLEELRNHKCNEVKE